jgi:hypothetical protein
MLQNKDVLAQYEANKTDGRGQFDPRKGVYRIISTHQGNCYGKPAQMALVNWKNSIDDEYSDLTSLFSWKHSRLDVIHWTLLALLERKS